MKLISLTLLIALGLSAPALADTQKAQALIDKHSKLPEFNNPGEAFDARACMKDKKMFVIPLTNSNPFNAAISRGFSDAAKMVGFQLRNWKTQMDPAGWIQGINTAIAEGYHLIDLQGGLPPEFLVPQITEARKAGIKVTATHNYDATTQKKPDFLDGAANTDYVTVGKIIAAWTIVKTGGKVNALVLGPDEITPTAPIRDAILNYLRDNCPDCKTKYINVPVNEDRAQGQ